MSWKAIVKEWTEQDAKNMPYGKYGGNPAVQQTRYKQELKEKIKARIEKLTAQITQLKQQEQALEQGTEMPIQQNKPQHFE